MSGMKKLFAVLALLFLALSAFAENKALKPAGSGSKEDPFQISRIEHLVWMGDNMRDVAEKNFKMTADIDASETKTWHNSRGFLPIGFIKEQKPSYSSVSFCGTFDGGGHVISNLFIDRKDQCAALFSSIGVPLSKYDFTANVLENLSRRSKNCATIKDLALVNCSFTGWNLAAGLAGKIESSLISGVYVSGILKSYRLTAGFAEIVNNSCLDECEIDLNFENRSCDAVCFFSKSQNSGLKNCLSKGSFQYSEDGNCGPSIKLEYNHPAYSIGIRPKDLSFYSISISGEGRPSFCNCLVLNSILSTKRKERLFYFPDSGNVQNSFYSADNLQKKPKEKSGCGLPNKKLMEKETYVDWDFDSVWEIEDWKSFPRLQRIEKMLKR